MKWKTKSIQVLKGIGSMMLLIPAPKDEELNLIKTDVEYSIELKRPGRKRSLNANSYCWLLCQRIAEKISRDGQYVSKEEIYREAIQDSQGFMPVCVQTKIANDVIRKWHHNGIGWTAINAGDSKIKGCTVLHLYAGSSSYTVEEMSRLIDCLVDEAHNVGASVEDSEYIQNLLNDWEDEENEQAETQG